MRYPFLDLATVNAPYNAQLKEAASRVIESGRYIGGAEVEALEREMSELTGSSRAIAVGNGLDALRLILRGYIELGRIAPGDGVIVPANTFIASVLAITDNGLRPILVDPNPATAILDASAVARGVERGAKAVMPVHLYGRIAWDEEMERVGRDGGLLVVEDAAQAIGARKAYGSGRWVAGSIGDAAGFSFYPTKNVGALGDAGIITTSDAELADVVASLRNYGVDAPYHNAYAGLNSRMDPIQAAFIRVKLQHVDDENAYRRRLARIYDRELNNGLVAKPVFVDDDSMVWHQYVVEVDDRERFMRYAAENGVETSAHYPRAIHQQPCYQSLAGEGELPVSEGLCARCVSLPITRCTSEADAHDIARILSAYPSK